MGWVDLHLHLLWALDDGCDTPDETLEAARLLASLGYEAAAPTPHAVPGLPSEDAGRCDARRAEAEALLADAGVALALHAGAENRLDEAFLARAGGPGRRGLGASGRWTLVELPFEGMVPALPELVFRMRRMGVLPLFAHPERCAEFERPGRAAEVVRLGGALQLNLGALSGQYGRLVRRTAERLLGEGLYAVAATDLHRASAAHWIEEGLAALEKRAGAAGLARLCGETPRRILAGEELP
ncbi:MAG TPA: CpsB/CapC family capsule biosynthesis tyrosine phosphatase [Anaeromyxobacteraceae bacterium]|nr:CpsB/CapC family capsule biosynthesis tyrosine phosphatase [Anaeromyxobacteraceae bacterium]